MSGNMNLRPYGNSWGPTAPTGGAGTMEEQAHARARMKLEQFRSGHSGDVEAGVDLMALIPSGLIALLLGGPFLLLTVAAFTDRNSGGAPLIFLMIALLFLSIPVFVFVRTRAQTPKGALLSFYRALGQGRFARARKLTLRADLDAFPRFQPSIAQLGRPTNYPRSFGDEQAFKDYWRELLLANPAPYCYATVKNVRESDIAPDMKLVDFELKFIMNTRLWLFLIFIALLIAVIVDLATRKTVTVHMRKLLVRVGNEWHIFSAEWQGYEEYNLNWLQAPQQHAPQTAAPAPQRESAPWDKPKTGGPGAPAAKAPWE